MSNHSVNIRALAAKVCFTVVEKGQSLAEALPKQAAKLEGKDKGLLQAMCYGVLRHLPELENHVRHLMDTPLKGKQRICHFLLLVGIYQLKHTRIPDHAALNETVAATGTLRNRHLKNLVNAVLRNYQRNPNVSTNSLTDPIKFNHPSWLIKKLQQAYPERWQQIIDANQQQPPMWLRVNQSKHSIETYSQLLEKADIKVAAIDPLSAAILLESPIDVNKLPEFHQGSVSVQDGAAQQSARLLDCQAGEHVLDCCAAPGGKTCHILELTPDISAMTAIDIEENRLVRVQENLDRIGLKAKLITANASTPETWWNGQLYDRILLDAPCSATGVIRRHPDIKWLRKSSDIDNLVALQAQILRKIWPLLKPGGTLLYATCSVLPEENSTQVKTFLADQKNAQIVALPESNTEMGWQILPSDHNMDGFYYAKLKKLAQ